MLNRKFPDTMATGIRLKFAKNNYIALFFLPTKLIQSAATSQWIKIK
jgi:hypothetical protein